MSVSRTYQIGEIAVSMDASGELTYWVYKHGWSPEQGGVSFCKINFGTKSVEDLGNYLAISLSRSADEYKRLIHTKQDKEDVEHEQL